MKRIKWLAGLVAMCMAVVCLTGCEDDDGTVTHKITFHNKSSYTVTQRVSGYGNFTLEPGTKRAFDDDSMSMYEYTPNGSVIRIRENMHTVVYKNR